MTKLSLPNESLTNNNLTAEANYLKILYDTKPRTSTGQASYTSTTSGVVYTTTGSLYDSQGQEGLLQILQNTLVNYLITATEYNEIVNRITEVEDEINPHLIQDSSETVKGHVELATPTETTAGTSTSLAIHPAGLKTELDKKINHSLATSVSDFLVSSGAGVFIKKTLAEVKTLLGLGTAAYTASTDYATSAQGTLANNAIPSSEKGVANGVPTLGSDTLIPVAQIPLKIVSGSYSGDGVGKTVSVGFTPKAVFVNCSTLRMFSLIGALSLLIESAVFSAGAGLAIVSGGFTIGANDDSANGSGVTYNYIAIG